MTKSQRAKRVDRFRGCATAAPSHTAVALCAPGWLLRGLRPLSGVLAHPVKEKPLTGLWGGDKKCIVAPVAFGSRVARVFRIWESFAMNFQYRGARALRNSEEEKSLCVGSTAASASRLKNTKGAKCASRSPLPGCMYSFELANSSTPGPRVALQQSPIILTQINSTTDRIYCQ